MSCSTTRPPRLSQLPVARRRRDVDRLRARALELLEVERPVVERRRQAEAELDERLLARAVAAVHAADLRDGHVALVDDEQEVLGEVVEQRGRRLARARGRRGGASSSRCRGRSPSRRASRGRSACAARAAAPRAACARRAARRGAPSAPSRMLSTARFSTSARRRRSGSRDRSRRARAAAARFPRSGSISASVSTASPKSSMRIARASS